MSSADSDGRMVPNVGGKSHKDPTFGGVLIPKLFYKIVVCNRDGQLAAAAFLLSQEDLLTTTDRIIGMPERAEEKLTDAEAKLYQVSVADIESLTGLDFGAVSSADVRVDEAEELRGPRQIPTLEDIRLV